MEEAAEVGLNFKRVEIISATEFRPGGGGVSAGIHAYRANDPSRFEVFKGVIAVALVNVVQVRLRGIGRGSLHHVEILRVGHRHRVQDQGIQDAEHDGVGANAEGQGNNRG